MESAPREDVVRHLSIAHERAAYKSFHDADWVGEIMSCASGMRLVSAVDSLTLSFRAIAMSLQMPWLTVEILKSYSTGFLSKSEPIEASFISTISDKLVEMVRHDLNAKQRRRLADAAHELARLADVAKDNANRRLLQSSDFEALWEDYRENPSFVMGLWQLARMCYGGLYFAYESFVRDCLFAVTGNDLTGELSANGRFFRAVESAFGAEWVRASIADEPVQVARETRNALVHDDGKESAQLRRHRHGFEVIDGRVVILPKHAQALYGALGQRAIVLVKKSAELLKSPSPRTSSK